MMIVWPTSAKIYIFKKTVTNAAVYGIVDISSILVVVVNLNKIIITLYDMI